MSICNSRKGGVAGAVATGVSPFPMSELAAKVEHLVSLTLGKVRAKDRELGAAINDVLDVYDPRDLAGAKAAIKLLDAGLARAKDPRSQQILRLALGVLVEAGAPPELAWPTAERGLIETLKVATRYAQAALESEDTPSIKEAVAMAGASLQKKMPREYAAWDSLKSRALLAIACLAHSPKLRRQMQKSRADLIAAVYPLEEDIEALLFLRQIMRVLPDQTMLVIHPEQRRGFRVEVKEVTTNMELMVLLHDAVIGDPKKGFIEGRRPSLKAIAALEDPDHAPKKPPGVALPFHWSSWRALRPDGTLPAASEQRPPNWVWFEGVPLDILPFQGERVILLTRPIMPRTMEIEASFEALTPSVTVKQKLSGAEVDRLLLRMGKAAVKADAIAVAEEQAAMVVERKKWDAEAKAHDRSLGAAKKKRAAARK
ncbi:hypothetical protein BH11MYX4_BH11MYX4_59320 [soil metagenome]